MRIKRIFSDIKTTENGKEVMPLLTFMKGDKAYNTHDTETSEVLNQKGIIEKKQEYSMIHRALGLFNQ